YHPVLDACFARLLFQPACSATLPVALWSQPHGRRHRRHPLGPDGPRLCAQLRAVRFCRHGGVRGYRGPGVFQSYGRKHRGSRMSSPVVQTSGISKRYRRGLRASSGLLRDSLARTLRSPLSVFQRTNQETFWALKEISLEVGEGEVLGLIGRNGSGKTTLLKILSRITQPTSGWAEIRGRVGSLLEVGTGFHPELTGRENTYLSGAILGMNRREIARKFDAIVSFAELEQFIDTPVKHYSSGMYVRLAFAVAAHLEPEILLVDEVLAVGDINFQKKCLGKMGDVARAGRTVVLVSHQLNQIRRLCHRVVWVDDGAIRQDGNTHEVVSAYESAMARNSLGEEAGRDAHAAAQTRFLSWEVVAPSGSGPHTLSAI